MFSPALPQPGRKPGGVDIYISRLADHLHRAGHTVCVYSYSPALRERATTTFACGLIASPTTAGAHERRAAPPESLRLRRGRPPSALGRLVLHPSRPSDRPDLSWLRSLRSHVRGALAPQADPGGDRPLGDARRPAGDRPLRRCARRGDLAPSRWSPARRGRGPPRPDPGRVAHRSVRRHLGRPEAGRVRAPNFHREVVPRLPDAQLWMVSDHCVETDRVRWFARPSDDELGELYSRAWVLAAPSLYEGFGVYYLEAMASDTMVVATPNPGSMYVLDQGRAGRLVQDDTSARRSRRPWRTPTCGPGTWPGVVSAPGTSPGRRRWRTTSTPTSSRSSVVASVELERTIRAGAGWTRSRSAARRPFCAGAGPERRSPSRRGPGARTGSRGIPRSDRGSSGAAGELGSPPRSP